MTAPSERPARSPLSVEPAHSARPARSAEPALSAQPAHSAPPAQAAPHPHPARSARVALPPQLALDENPRRAVTSINVRHDDKVVFDQLQSWWSVERGLPLSQWEAFTVLLVLALESPGLELPERVRARLSGV